MKTYHVGAPKMGSLKCYKELVEEIFENNWYTNNGKFVRTLEQRLSDYLGVKHCVLVTNGTLGLQIAAKAMKLTGDVLIPAYTFIATAQALTWIGLSPVFCDVDPKTHQIDWKDVQSRINWNSKNLSAILGVHLWGASPDIARLAYLAEKYKLRLFFDAAHAFGSFVNGQLVGGFGDCEVFSFHATKIFNTFEGGAITTNDDEIAERARQLRNFGFDRMGLPTGLEGTNAKMSEVSAAMGLINLSTVSGRILNNKRIYETYHNFLAKIPGIRVYSYLRISRECYPNYQYMVIEVEERRNQLQRFLIGHKILARAYFNPRMFQGSMPAAEKLLDRVLCLPMVDTEEEAYMICSLIRDFMLDNQKERR